MRPSATQPLNIIKLNLFKLTLGRARFLKMISIKHKIIFIHIPKCAGQSIETMFLKDLALNWEERGQLLLRPKRVSEKGPERLAHLYAEEYFKFGYISKEKFDKFLKFSIIRDPVDRILSELNFQGIPRKNSKNAYGFKSIEEYISKVSKLNKFSDLRRHISPQVKFLYDSDTNKLLVDKIIHFEELNHEVPKILQNKLNLFLEVPRINSSKKKFWCKKDLSTSDFIFLNDFYESDFKFLENMKSNYPSKK